MPIKLNFNQSDTGVSFSPGMGVPTMMWTPQSAKIA